MNKVHAKTHWVWTSLAEETWDNRYNNSGKQRIAGEPIHGDPNLVDEAWIKRGYVIDSSEYVQEGQLSLFEI